MKTEDTDTIEKALRELEKVQKELDELQKIVSDIANIIGYDEYIDARDVIRDEDIPF